MFVLRPGGERLGADPVRRRHCGPFNLLGFHTRFAVGSRGEIWYGTVGNGWGRSTDGGKTWRNWEYRQLGPEWQYVTPNGIVTRGDTVYIATADGIKVTWDGGATWRVITDSAGVTTTKDSVWGTIGSQYILALGRATDSSLLVSHLRGVARSVDGGRTFTQRVPVTGCRTRTGECPRAFLIWVDTVRNVVREPVRSTAHLGSATPRFPGSQRREAKPGPRPPPATRGSAARFPWKTSPTSTRPTASARP